MAKKALPLRSQRLSDPPPPKAATRTPVRTPVATPKGPEPIIPAVPEPMPLGVRIRRLRQERGWKLAELSARSGIAISTLSKVETGALSLAYDRLLKVANAFDLGLSEFLAPPQSEAKGPAQTGRISFARSGSGAQVVTPGYNYHYLCENLRLKSMVPILSECTARSLDEFGPLLRHDGEEFTFVVKGRVQFLSEFYGPEVLEEGEGVYIDSRMGHAYLNAGPGPCWILSVNYSPAKAGTDPS
ncbi:MAG: helix-turn-helix domain-containing protein [Alphaproteobacteria bacterium]|nr:helix-turn-helix domain-containing protein [Alphaproteobacteria bacterium]